MNERMALYRSCSNNNIEECCLLNRYGQQQQVDEFQTLFALFPRLSRLPVVPVQISSLLSVCVTELHGNDSTNHSLPLPLRDMEER